MLKNIYVFFFVAVLVNSVTNVGSVNAKLTFDDAQSWTGDVAKNAGITDADVSNVVGRGIKGAIGLVGIFFFILMVYGGFLWMTARGNDEQVTKAQDLIKDAIIGMIVVVMAYGITVAVGKFVG